MKLAEILPGIYFNRDLDLNYYIGIVKKILSIPRFRKHDGLEPEYKAAKT